MFLYDHDTATVWQVSLVYDLVLPLGLQSCLSMEYLVLN